MDPAADMADQHEAGQAAPLLGPAARAFGKGALVAYWIACLSVIAFGLSRMEWRSPPAKPAQAAATAPARPAVTPRAPAPSAAPTRPPSEAPLRSATSAGPAPAPTDWLAGVLVVFSIAGPVWLALRTWRRRGSRQLGRFSGKRRRLGSVSRSPLWLD